MRNVSPVRGRRAGAVICGFVLCAALPAAADYDSTDVSGNLQDQCKEFSAAVVKDTSFTVSATCNDKAGGTRSTKFDLSGDVSWDTSNHVLAWDATLAGSVQDIAAKCKPKSSDPFTTSSSDVTLALTCSIQTYGTPETQSPSLALNGELTATDDGYLQRR